MFVILPLFIINDQSINKEVKLKRLLRSIPMIKLSLLLYSIPFNIYSQKFPLTLWIEVSHRLAVVKKGIPAHIYSYLLNSGVFIPWEMIWPLIFLDFKTKGDRLGDKTCLS